MNKVIDIVGGAYFEECCYPRKKLFRGSGVRAAALISNWDYSVSLTTALGPLAHEFRDLAEHLSFKLVIEEKEDDIAFRYRHPLSVPTISGLISRDLSYTGVVNADSALVFGMLEGRPKVQAKKVVYDPQDGKNATPFSSNGSYAEQLAMVVSYSEGKALTSRSNPDSIAGALLDNPNVKVVVVKCGASGALVATPSSKGWVSAFPTDNVFKIGSGDVFTGTFATEWLLRESDPFDAAWIASRVTAEYVESGLDRISLDRYRELQVEALKKRDGYSDLCYRAIPKKQIYLAGPFFNTAEQWRIDEAREALLDMGFSVFSPIHDVGEGPTNEIAQADLKGLNESEVVLAILDGMDCGTIFEIGYARARDIPVVVIAEHVDSKHLTMISGSGCTVTSDFSAGIYKAGWAVMGDSI